VQHDDDGDDDADEQRPRWPSSRKIPFTPYIIKLYKTGAAAAATN